MKRYLIAMLIISCVGCNTNPNKEKSATDSTGNSLSTSLVSNPNTADGVDSTKLNQMATMDFKDTLHDFGTIQQDEVVEHDFSFTNNGKTPLIITTAEGSCGCTIPEYPHDPVTPGMSGIIKVKFNSAGKSGHEEKSVRIVTNGKRSTSMLYIKAEVNVPKGSKELLNE